MLLGREDVLAKNNVRARHQPLKVLDNRPLLGCRLHGVTAAHTAGAITIMVPDMVTPTDESRARCAAVVADLHEVTEMLRTRGRFGRRSF